MVRTINMAVIIGLLATAAGCAAAPSPAATLVKESDEKSVAQCELISTVYGGSLIGGVVTTGATNAMVDAREKAAALGATHIVFSHVDGGGTYSVGRATARAYNCSKSR